jgi:hypothetical protein
LRVRAAQLVLVLVVLVVLLVLLVLLVLQGGCPAAAAAGRGCPAALLRALPAFYQGAMCTGSVFLGKPGRFPHCCPQAHKR